MRMNHINLRLLASFKISYQLCFRLLIFFYVGKFNFQNRIVLILTKRLLILAILDFVIAQIFSKYKIQIRQLDISNIKNKFVLIPSIYFNYDFNYLIIVIIPFLDLTLKRTLKGERCAFNTYLMIVHCFFEHKA